jgi:hypothetical protein
MTQVRKEQIFAQTNSANSSTIMTRDNDGEVCVTSLNITAVNTASPSLAEYSSTGITIDSTVTEDFNISRESSEEEGVAGYDIVIRGQTGGPANVSLIGGAGGDVALIGGVGGSGFGSQMPGQGGSVGLTGGMGQDGVFASYEASAGGDVVISGGQAGAHNGGLGAVGGGVYLIGGQGTATSGASGGIVGLTGGPSTTDGGQGGTVILAGGPAFNGAGGSGGGISITSGDGPNSAGSAGNITIITGVSVSGNSQILINGGTVGDTITIGGTGRNINISGIIFMFGVTTWQGGGYPDLPNGAGVFFAINGTQVGSTVTAPNLDTLTNGGDAEALHTHASLAFTGTSGESIDIGMPVGFENSGGNPRVFQADADAGGNRHFCTGIAGNSPVSSGLSTIIYTSGERSIIDATWDSVPVAADVGKLVFLSENAGKLTLTAPSNPGSYAQRVGFVTRGGTGVVKIEICLGDSFLN